MAAHVCVPVCSCQCVLQVCSKLEREFCNFLSAQWMMKCSATIEKRASLCQSVCLCLCVAVCALVCLCVCVCLCMCADSILSPCMKIAKIFDKLHSKLGAHCQLGWLRWLFSCSSSGWEPALASLLSMYNHTCATVCACVCVCAWVGSLLAIQSVGIHSIQIHFTETQRNRHKRRPSKL